MFWDSNNGKVIHINFSVYVSLKTWILLSFLPTFYQWPQRQNESIQCIQGGDCKEKISLRQSSRLLSNSWLETRSPRKHSFRRYGYRLKRKWRLCKLRENRHWLFPTKQTCRLCSWETKLLNTDHSMTVIWNIGVVWTAQYPKLITH